MSPIVRFKPGDTAPVSTTYVLVDHFKTSCGVAQWFEQGAKFPLATVANGTGPFWYVRVDEATSYVLAA